MKQTKKKSNNGITLVALVITIIILLILAGITISSLTNSGLFEKTKLAKERTEDKEKLENTTLQEYENKIAEYINGSRETTGANSQNTMSATEHFTGEYYFNGKPIYAKTFFIESLPNSTIKTYNHNIENIDSIWCDVSKCFVDWGGGSTTPLSFVASYIASNIYIGNSTDTWFQLGTNADRTALHAYVTLNYTKTTDKGNGTTIIATPAN